MPRLTPHQPIFKVDKIKGSVEVGNTPSTPPPAPLPTTLTLIGDLSGSGGTTLDGPGIAMSSTLVLVGGVVSEATEFFSIDISTPSAPTILDSINDPDSSSCLGVARSGNYAFFTSFDGITAVNVSTPAALSIVGFLAATATLPEPYGIAIAGNYAYITNAGSQRVTVVDISNPAAMTEVGATSSSSQLTDAYNIAMYGNYAIVPASGVNRLTVVDVSTPASPAIVGSLLDNTNLDGATDLVVVGNHAWVAVNDSDRVTVVDLSTPSSPTLVGSLQDNTNLNFARGIAAYDSRFAVVISAGTAGVGIATLVDMVDPSAPVIIDTLTDALITAPYTIDGASPLFAFLNEGDNLLAIVEVT